MRQIYRQMLQKLMKYKCYNISTLFSIFVLACVLYNLPIREGATGHRSRNGDSPSMNDTSMNDMNNSVEEISEVTEKHTYQKYSFILRSVIISLMIFLVVSLMSMIGIIGFNIGFFIIMITIIAFTIMYFMKENEYNLEISVMTPDDLYKTIIPETAETQDPSSNDVEIEEQEEPTDNNTNTQSAKYTYEESTYTHEHPHTHAETIRKEILPSSQRKTNDTSGSAGTSATTGTAQNGNSDDELAPGEVRRGGKILIPCGVDEYGVTVFVEKGTHNSDMCKTYNRNGDEVVEEEEKDGAVSSSSKKNNAGLTGSSKGSPIKDANVDNSGVNKSSGAHAHTTTHDHSYVHDDPTV